MQTIESFTDEEIDRFTIEQNLSLLDNSPMSYAIREYIKEQAEEYKIFADTYNKTRVEIFNKYEELKDDYTGHPNIRNILSKEDLDTLDGFLKHRLHLDYGLSCICELLTFVNKKVKKATKDSTGVCSPVSSDPFNQVRFDRAECLKNLDLGFTAEEHDLLNNGSEEIFAKE